MNSKQRQLLYIATGTLLALLYLIISGLTFWFMMLLLLWIIFILVTKGMIPQITIASTSFMIIFIILIVISISLTFFTRGNISDNSNDSENSELNSDSSNPQKTQDIVLEYYSGELNGSVQFTDKDQASKTATYYLGVVLRYSQPEDIKLVTVKNIRLSNQLIGSSINLLQPTGGYKESFNNNGSDKMTFTPVADGVATSHNVIDKHTGLLSFRIESVNAFKFDTNAAFAMSDAGLLPSRTFQYANISASQLNNTLSFDLEMNLDNGETITKHFTGAVDGSTLYEKGAVASIELILTE